MAVAVPSMMAISQLEVFPSIRKILTTRTIREEAGVRDEGGNHRVDPGDRGDLVEDQVEVAVDQGVMAGMEVREDSDLCTISLRESRSSRRDRSSWKRSGARTKTVPGTRRT